MSYALEGIKWGSDGYGTDGGVVTWSADFGDALDFDPARYESADFLDSLTAAFDAWEEVAAIDFEYVADGGMIGVGMDALAGSTVGLASTTFTSGGETAEFLSAEIDFDSLETWAPFGAGGVDFYAVALHEIGHVIGLGHVSDVSEIMNPVISTDGLGDGDIAGAQEIYGAATPPFSGEETPPTEPLTLAEETGPSSSPEPEPQAAEVDGEEGGIFQWFFDLIAAIFGGGGESTEAASAAAVVVESDSEGVTVADLLPVGEILDEDLPDPEFEDEEWAEPDFAF